MWVPIIQAFNRFKTAVKTNEDNEKPFKLVGNNLDELSSTAIDDLSVPTFVHKACSFILFKGLTREGIFRLNGSLNNFEQMKNDFYSDLTHDFSPKDDPILVACLLKFFIRNLSEPILPFMFIKKLLIYIREKKNENNHMISEIKIFLINLSPIKYNLLAYLTIFLNELSTAQDKNRMSPAALAVVMSPNFIGLNEPSVWIKWQTWANQLISILIKRPYDIFDCYNKIHHYIINNNTSSPSNNKIYQQIIRNSKRLSIANSYVDLPLTHHENNLTVPEYPDNKITSIIKKLENMDNHRKTLSRSNTYSPILLSTNNTVNVKATNSFSTHPNKEIVTQANNHIKLVEEFKAKITKKSQDSYEITPPSTTQTDKLSININDPESNKPYEGTNAPQALKKSHVIRRSNIKSKTRPLPMNDNNVLFDSESKNTTDGRNVSSSSKDDELKSPCYENYSPNTKKSPKIPDESNEGNFERRAPFRRFMSVIKNDNSTMKHVNYTKQENSIINKQPKDFVSRIIESLQRKRIRHGLPDRVEEMNFQQLNNEKLLLRRAISFYENTNGKPVTEPQQMASEPLYSRYAEVIDLIEKLKKNLDPAYRKPSSVSTFLIN